jgi:hypothetical protein
MGGTGTTPVEASNGASMWQAWERNAKPKGITWDQFQQDFRKANPKVGADGMLNAGATYQVPVYTPPAPEPGAGPANTDPHAPGAPSPGTTIPTGQADGSSPASAIPIAPGQALDAITPQQVYEAIEPDAFVIAVRGKIGVQDIPGWKKVPGLKELGENAEVGYLLATLTPMEPEGLNPNFSPKDTTVFLSLNIPKQQPVVFSVKASDLTAEAGVPIKNVVDKPAGIILFSNGRAGVSAGDPGPVASVNGGILFELPNLKETAGQVKDLVKKVTRAAQGAQLAAGVVSAPGTAGGSLAASAGGIIGTEMLRGTLDNSLDNAKWYAGFAWRAEGRMPIEEDGSVTLLAKKGPLEGKWISFNVKDVADSFFGGNIPDFKNPNKQWLVNAGVKPEIADAISGQFQVNDIKPLMDQTAEYLDITTEELLQWYNQQGEHWVSGFAYNRLRYMEPDENGRYPEMLLDPSGKELPATWRVNTSSIKDLVEAATRDGRPMPRGA